MDLDWVAAKEREVKQQTDRLEHELKTYKNNLIKESIRMGNEDLGKHYYMMGDLPNALKAYGRMREFCTTPKHVAEMTMKVLLISIMQHNWMGVQSHRLKVQQLGLKAEDKAKTDPILFACSGLAHLGNGSYYDGIRDFLKVSFDYTTGEPQADINWAKEVMTGNDIAVYGGLCALASMDREELRRRVLDNSDFRQFLELEPQIRRAISMFCQSKYAACLSILDSYATDYQLDIYLHQHIKYIYSRIRSKSIVQYFIPFSCVTLDEMQKQFPSPQGIEQELEDLIRGGELNARIDLVERVNPRFVVFVIRVH